MKKSLYLTETTQSLVYKTFILLICILLPPAYQFFMELFYIFVFFRPFFLGAERQNAQGQNCCIIATQEFFWKEAETLIVLAKVSTLYDLDFNLPNFNTENYSLYQLYRLFSPTILKS